jgi:hypothetical protein
MRPEQLKELFLQDESIHLEYKSRLNLNKGNEGKAKFLREVLSLANSLQRRAYLVIGVKEKNKEKEFIGMSGITEEQIQQVIAKNCRPTIDFIFETITVDKKKFGVMTIFSSRPPHTVKKRFGYEETRESHKRPKQNSIEEHEVFVRRGSTIEKASPEEIIEMAQRDRNDLSSVVSRLDRIADWQEETAEAIYSQNKRISSNDDNWASWFAVPIFIALITGALLGWQWQEIPHEFFSVVSSVISFFILSTFSVFRVSEFTFKQAFLTIIILALVFFGLGKATPSSVIMQVSILRVTFLSFVGAGGGLLTSIVTMFNS